MKKSHESSVRILTPVVLQPLLPDERKEVVQKGLAEAEKKNGFKTSIEDDALELISTFSEGYPHFIQQYAFSAFENDNDNVIDANDLLNALFKENGALHLLGIRYFENMYTDDIRSNDYRKVLQVLAQHAPTHVARKTIIEESGLKRHTVDNALSALKKRGTVIPKPGQRGLFRLPSRSFAAWILAFKIAKTKN